MASDDLTVAVLTPIGRGAVAVVAVEGADAATIVAQFFHPRGALPLIERRVNSIVYGRWSAARAGGDGDNGEQGAAEDVIVCLRDNQSVEVHCHGGHAAIARVTDDLLAAGARKQSWQQWIARHAPNSIRAAAGAALPQAVTLRTAAILLDQQQGALEAAIREISHDLERLIHHSPSANSTAAQLIPHDIETLLSRAAIGLHLTQPWRVVLAGPPNVGKSSLINALLGYQRAIVFDQPGTTRDAVTALAALDGWPVVLTDTAGWRESNEPLETTAVGIARNQAAQADCLLLVFDATQLWTDEHAQLIDRWRPAIVVQNKIDLIAARHIPSDSTPAAASPAATKVVGASALTGQGLEALAQAIVTHLVPIAFSPGQAVPFTPQQVEQLRSALAELDAGQFESARSVLLSMLA